MEECVRDIDKFGIEYEAQFLDGTRQKLTTTDTKEGKRYIRTYPNNDEDDNLVNIQPIPETEIQHYHTGKQPYQPFSEYFGTNSPKPSVTGRPAKNSGKAE